MEVVQPAIRLGLDARKKTSASSLMKANDGMTGKRLSYTDITIRASSRFFRDRTCPGLQLASEIGGVAMASTASL